MFYGILFVIFIIVCAVFTLSESENRNFVTGAARFIDSLFSAFGAGVFTWCAASYITNLLN